MKKRKLIGFAAIAAAVIALSGCSVDTGSNKSAEESGVKETVAESKPEEEKQADIVIIGAGGAGMTAAIEAAKKGASNLVVLEKMPITGGNTVRATGGLNAAETPYQKAEGIEDSIELFIEDTMKGGRI